MKKIISSTITFLILFTSSCVVEPLVFHPSEYSQPEPKYLIICKESPNNGRYIWKKDCLVLNKQ